jgi:ElaB/YqjD/DUF883 family membrane-anchored ribosome-binding protein
MASASDSNELAKVKEELAALRKDLAALTESYKKTARDEADGLAARARTGAEQVGAKAREGVSAISEQIEERPLTSALVAFAAGLVIGRLLDRR